VLLLKKLSESQGRAVWCDEESDARSGASIDRLSQEMLPHAVINCQYFSGLLFEWPAKNCGNG
jgi:hypothetical protein